MCLIGRSWSGLRGPAQMYPKDERTRVEGHAWCVCVVAVVSSSRLGGVVRDDGTAEEDRPSRHRRGLALLVMDDDERHRPLCEPDSCSRSAAQWMHVGERPGG